MEVIVRIVKVNPWTGLTKWPTTFDYVGPYWTRYRRCSQIRESLK